MSAFKSKLLGGIFHTKNIGSRKAGSVLICFYIVYLPLKCRSSHIIVPSTRVLTPDGGANFDQDDFTIKKN